MYISLISSIKIISIILTLFILGSLLVDLIKGKKFDGATLMTIIFLILNIVAIYY